MTVTVKPYLVLVVIGLVLALINIEYFTIVDIFIVAFLVIASTVIEILEYLDNRRE